MSDWEINELSDSLSKVNVNLDVDADMLSSIIDMMRNTGVSLTIADVAHNLQNMKLNSTLSETLNSKQGLNDINGSKTDPLEMNTNNLRNEKSAKFIDQEQPFHFPSMNETKSPLLKKSYGNINLFATNQSPEFTFQSPTSGFNKLNSKSNKINDVENINKNIFVEANKTNDTHKDLPDGPFSDKNSLPYKGPFTTFEESNNYLPNKTLDTKFSNFFTLARDSMNNNNNNNNNNDNNLNYVPNMENINKSKSLDEDPFLPTFVPGANESNNRGKSLFDKKTKKTGKSSKMKTNNDNNDNKAVDIETNGGWFWGKGKSSSKGEYDNKSANKSLWE